MADDPKRRMMPRTLVLVGAGKMGGAMLEGWMLMGMRPDGVTILDPNISPEVSALGKSHGVSINPPLNEVQPSDVFVLAIKPQSLDAVAPVLRAIIKQNALVISILAGKTIANICDRIPVAHAVVRAMPNLPAAVRRGITGAVASHDVAPGQREAADVLLSGIGEVVWVKDESLIDAVTAVSGSGPAYIFHMVEALAAAGADAGLPPDIALKLARATVEGAGEMLHRSDMPAGILRQNVTSPGGTTAAALEVLMAENGLTSLMRKTVAAAKRRAEELSG
jgi:pyrroline-5-carboxylate reductase